MENDKKIKIQSIVAAALAVVVLVVLVGSIVAVTLGLKDSDRLYARQSLSETTDMYCNTVIEKIGGDVETLHTLAALLQDKGAYDYDAAKAYLPGYARGGNFANVGIVAADGTARFFTRDGKEFARYVGDENHIVSAWDGKVSLSDAFDDPTDTQTPARKINGYAIPLYRDDKIVSVLIGTVPTEELARILEYPIYNGYGIVHLIDAKGNFIARNERIVYKRPMTSIFEGDNVTDADRRVMQAALSSGELYFSEFGYQNADYWMMFMPVALDGIYTQGGWNLFCIVPKSALSDGMTMIALTLSGVFGVIFLVFLVLFVYLFVLTQKNRREMYDLAYIDGLTGIYNREKFRKEATARMTRDKNADFALVLIDLQNFHFFNKNFSYEMGNELLRHVAQTLKEETREGELYGRGEADTFKMLLVGGTEDELRRRVLRICRKAVDFEPIRGTSFHLVCNGGISVVPAGARNPDFYYYLDYAHMALRKVKGSHECSAEVFNETMAAKEREEKIIESTMQRALEKGRLQLYLQPKIDLTSGFACGAEALMRWVRDDGTIVPPDAFIPIFERTGFIVESDLFAVKEACRLLVRWREAGKALLPISVNQSKRLIYSTNYVRRLIDTVDAVGAPREMLILEITEGLAVEDMANSVRILDEMRRAGFRISLDDFGSGYSSLNVVQEFPIDELKLDRMFLAKTDHQERRNAVMRNIVSLAREMGIATVVEGVETREQAQFARSIGCNIAQGYYYDRPVSAAEYENRYLSGVVST